MILICIGWIIVNDQWNGIESVNDQINFRPSVHFLLLFRKQRPETEKDSDPDQTLDKEKQESNDPDPSHPNYEPAH